MNFTVFPCLVHRVIEFYVKKGKFPFINRVLRQFLLVFLDNFFKEAQNGGFCFFLTNAFC